MDTNRIVVAQLAKAPIVGKVKTRLTPALSAAQACSVHCYLCRQVFLNLHRSALWNYELWVSEPHSFFQSLNPVNDESLNIKKQVDGDLGRRMAAITEWHFKEQKNEVSILVGSDCPFIDASLIESVAADFLDKQHDVSLVPADDGGYVLIAMRQYIPELFQGITWGENVVLSQTIEVMNKLNLSFRLHPALNDIDRPEDLQFLSENEQRSALSFTHFR